jgi:hypothetical protein
LVDFVDPVLVVDDLNTMTRIVDGMLRKCGFANVDQVHDGPTALHKLRDFGNTPDEPGRRSGAGHDRRGDTDCRR